ncbi:MAG: hypothetical protein HWD61_15605 [Parachlamydiaceae bacterium]|nr:MAG: hypothetical protein HWD61_15605 [Parachlamydiaceae bacterium]
MYKQIFLCAFSFSMLLASASFAEHVVWEGQLAADGTPSPVVDLKLNKTYEIVVSGSVNLGKWVEAGKPLAQDASYEYNAPSGPTKAKTFRNSSDIPLNDSAFNPTHVYRSEPFVAKQNKIHFWIQDADYSDNTGNLTVKVQQLN